MESKLTTLHGAYGVVKDMPARLRDIAEGAPSALHNIMGHIEHQGTLYPLTTAVVPLLIEMLAGDNRADNAQILDQLHFLIETMDETIAYRVTSMRGGYVQNLMRLHTALADGATVYLHLLSHTHTRIRQRAAIFVALFVEPAAARAALRQRFESEPDVTTQAVLLRSWGKLPPSNEADGDPKANAAEQDRFIEIATAASSPLLRRAAAMAWVVYQLSATFGRHTELPPVIEEILFDIVLDKYSAPDSAGQELDAVTLAKFETLLNQHTEQAQVLQRENPPNLLEKLQGMLDEVNELLSINSVSEAVAASSASVQAEETALPHYIEREFEAEVVFGLLMSFGSHVQERLLASPRLTPYVAHLICREALDGAFKRVHHVTEYGIKGSDSDGLWRRWEQYIDFLQRTRTQPQQLIYQSSDTAAQNKQDALHYGALKMIVNCDAFWKLPTNVFSFFYALPDDREALRTLMEQYKPSYLSKD